MRLVSSDIDYKLYKVDSESELQECIRVKRAIVLGENAQKEEFYLVHILADNVEIFVGIFNEGSGITPTVIKFKEILLISSDSTIYFIDIINNTIIKEVECISLIYDVILSEDGKRIYVICELSITCLNILGHIIWNYDSDIITDYQFENKIIKIVSDGREYKILLENGKSIK